MNNNFQSVEGYSSAKNKDIEIAVDFRHSSWPVKHRFIDDFTGEGWQSTPFQTADVQGMDANGVLMKVNDWLEGQY